MKSRPGQGLTEISKKIRHKQNDHARETLNKAGSCNAVRTMRILS
jgi:hypothetical protein